MKPAAFGLVLILLALPFVVHANEDLVAKREACRQEARTRIAPMGKVDVEGYQRIVERRNVHVSQCMAHSAVDHDTSKPTEGMIRKLKEGPPKSQISASKKVDRRSLKHTERKKQKMGLARMLKSRKGKTRSLKHLPRAGK